MSIALYIYMFMYLSICLFIYLYIHSIHVYITRTDGSGRPARVSASCFGPDSQAPPKIQRAPACWTEASKRGPQRVPYGLTKEHGDIP